MTNIREFEKLNKEYKKIINTRKRIYKNLQYRTDIEKAYEGLFLYSVTLFENYLEALFLGFLKNKYKIKRGKGIKLKQEISFSKDISDKNLKKFLLGEKTGSYLDWLPYKEKTITRSKKFFIDGKPFTDLNIGNKEVLKEIIKIRNFIAHKSKESKEQIDDLYSFKILSIYFLFNKTHSNGRNYFDHFIIELNSISGLLQQYIYTK